MKSGRIRSIIREQKRDIASRFLDLMKEWDYERNTDIDLACITAASNHKVWRKCETGHSYHA